MSMTLIKTALIVMMDTQKILLTYANATRPDNTGKIIQATANLEELQEALQREIEEEVA